MNLPNKLTMLRICLVPVFMIVMITPMIENDILCRIIAAALFIVTSLTDMLDGKIARKYNLITNFGKLMDPLADKFMVFGAMLSILYRFDYIRPVFVWAAAVVMFRELAVTSIRLVAAGNEGVVIAASWLGKVKTVTQIVCICTVLLEPVVLPFKAFRDWHLLSYFTIAAMVVMTLWSGIDYMRTYWKFIKLEK